MLASYSMGKLLSPLQTQAAPIPDILTNWEGFES